MLNPPEQDLLCRHLPEKWLIGAELFTVKGVATFGGVVALAAVGAALLAPSAGAEGSYGFFAYSPGTGTMGLALNYPTPEDAEARAMQECAQDDCKLTREEAENDALSRVPGATIVGWGCSGNNPATPTGEHGYVD